MVSSARRNVAVILAGGVGTRVGIEIPKQLLKVAGRPVLAHTIEVFESLPTIDEIVVMMADGYVDQAQRIVTESGFRKVTAVLPGGQTRNDSTLAAIRWLGDGECNVLFHDAVRPLVSARIINDLVAALERFSAVDTVIPSADTIISIDPQTDTIADVLPRHLLRRGQTPQAFRLSTIRAAYAVAADDPDFVATDDCTVVLRYLPDVPVGVIDGDDQNMKITEPIDVFIADKLFQLRSNERPRPKTADQYAALLAGKGLVVFGGSSGIGADIADRARGYGAHVAVYSRTTTGTHVERQDDIRDARTDAVNRLGRIDFVINTAGVLPRGELAQATPEQIRHATEVNYLAPIFIAQEFHPLLKATRGSLLLFTSSSYTRGRASYSLYSSAKAAVVNLTQALADEWSPDGVRVNCINPERTGTPMRTAAFGAEPPGTLLDSKDVASVALDVVLSDYNGHTVDVRLIDPTVSRGDGTLRPE